MSANKFALPLKQMLNPGVTKDAFLAFLQANKLPMPTLEKSIAYLCYYDQRALVTSTTTRFFGNQSGTTQNTNMKNVSYTLPQDEHFAILGIRILIGTGPTLNSIDWAYGADAAYAKNSLIKVQLNNLIQFNLLPLTIATPDLTTDDNGFIQFQEPVLWKGQTAITIEVTTQGTVAANESLRIEVHGIGLTS